MHLESALPIVKALADSPWGVFTVAMSIPIAVVMGLYMRYVRPGKVLEVSIGGFVMLMAALWFGKDIAEHPYWGDVFRLSGTSITWWLV